MSKKNSTNHYLSTIKSILTSHRLARMLIKPSCLFLPVLFTLFIVGCSIKEDPETKNEKDYKVAIAEAWEFLSEKGWNDLAKNNWQTASVEETIVTTSYDLLDEKYVGKKVLIISFEDQDKVVVGTPSVLVDEMENKVVGYILGE